MEGNSAVSTTEVMLQEKLEALKTTIIEELDKKLSSEICTILQDLKEIGTESISDPVPSPARRREPRQELPSKVFVMRNSVLTDMWSTPHFNSFYNICTALFILLIMSTVALYIADAKRFSDDVDFLAWTFGNISGWVSIWVCMNLAELLVLYPLYNLWAHSRTHTPRISFLDTFFAGLFVIYLIASVSIPAFFVLYIGLPPISSFFVLMEQTRIFMKSYAFVRENVPYTLNYKVHQDGDKDDKTQPCPDFQKFIYFLFAPTFVYRDEYPRTTTIRWNYVAWNFFQVIITILTTYIVFRRFVVVIFADVGNEQFTMEYFVLVFSGAIVAGSAAMFLGFYGFLHCWLNAFAEMLTFGDRLFYKDWWNSTSFSTYYRTWNGVVHDWIYGYIYRDIYQLFGRNQGPALVTVFLFSAIIHEYILILTLKLFYPVLFVLFAGAGIGIVFITRRKTSQIWNIFLWCSLFLGWGVMIVLYSMEWYARKNCPQTLEMPWDFFVPRSWTCPVLHIPFFHVEVN